MNESRAAAQVTVPTENKQRAEVLRKAGFELYRQKRDTEAIIQYEAALQLHASAGLYYDYANSLSNIDGRLEDSIKAYRIGIKEPVQSWRIEIIPAGSGVYKKTFCANSGKTYGFVLEYDENQGEIRVKKGDWTREGNKIIVHYKQEIGKKGVGPTEEGPRGPYHLKFEPYEREIDETETLDFLEISSNMMESDGPCPEYRF
jgi:tetratricopeptide (TPR) repeat protein